MIHKNTLLSFCLAIASLHADGLAEQYLITYGNPQASTTIVEYFSFSCPHCIRLFHHDFPAIKDQYLDTDQVYWIFHPIPVDLPTVQAMACLDQLTNEKKQIFLEEILLAAAEPHPVDSALLMEKVMEVFNKPSPQICNLDALETTNAFLAAFEFVKAGLTVEGVPCVAINDYLYPNELPTKGFVERMLRLNEETG